MDQASPQPFGIAGVRVGHHTDAVGGTGCTVVVFDRPAVAAGEVRGGAPATRESALLDVAATVETVDAVVLSGGSAFGLAAADGVVAHLEAEGRGVATPHGPVPIVVGLSLYDRGVGDPTARPSVADGAAAYGDASPEAVLRGRVGAGTGATVGKWRGPEHAAPAGLGHAVVSVQGITVVALIAVNAWGEVVGEGEPLPALPPDLAQRLAQTATDAVPNTTIGLVVTDAALTKVQCAAVAKGGHAGLARAIHPVHTPFDGDALVVASIGAGPPAPVALVAALADRAVCAAVRSAA